jgi:hypothetical protein
MNIRGLLCFVIAAVMTMAQPASAATPKVFAPPQDLAIDAIAPQVVMGPAGDATVVWQGLKGGLFVARRSVLGGRLSAPEKVVDENVNAYTVRVARNDRGDVAIAWAASVDNVFRPRVVIAPPGQSFGPPADVPLPPRAPVPGEDTGRQFGWPELVVAPDGTVAVGFSETDYGANVSRTLVSTRPPGGEFRPPQVLATSTGAVWEGPITMAPKLAMDADGRLIAAWVFQPGPLVDGAKLLMAEAAPGQPFGPARTISDPSLPGVSDARLAVNPRGDVVAAWTSHIVQPLADTHPGRLDVMERSPSGAWSARHALSSNGVTIATPTVALNDAGDAIVAVPTTSGMATSFRGAHVGFGAAVPSPVAYADGSEVPIAIDALGDSVSVRSDDQTVFAQLRVRGAEPEPEVPVSAPSKVYGPNVAMDGFGNGIVVWNENRRGVAVITAASYSALPPVVAKLRVRKHKFSMSANEPALVRIAVRRKRGGRKASQITVARPGANGLKFDKRMRHLLKRKGRYTMTVRAYDAGPRHTTYKVKFRRR